MPKNQKSRISERSKRREFVEFTGLATTVDRRRTLEKLLGDIRLLLILISSMIVATGGVLIVGSYLFGLFLRVISENPLIETSSDSAKTYTAEYAPAGGNYYVLKLYRTADRHLLAERTYYNSREPWLIWENNRLIYADYGDDWYFYDGAINLPPTNWDTAMTHIP